jgi:hypothetical protein
VLWKTSGDFLEADAAKARELLPMRWDSALDSFTPIFGLLFMLLVAIFPAKAQTSAPIGTCGAFGTPKPRPQITQQPYANASPAIAESR